MASFRSGSEEKSGVFVDHAHSERSEDEWYGVEERRDISEGKQRDDGAEEAGPEDEISDGHMNPVMQSAR